MGSVWIDSHCHDLCTSWWRVDSFTPLPLYSGERAPGTHWIGGLIDPRVGLDDMEKLKFFTLPGIEVRPLCRLARIQSLYQLSKCGFHLVYLVRKNNTDLPQSVRSLRKYYYIILWRRQPHLPTWLREHAALPNRLGTELAGTAVTNALRHSWRS
jgi:hypothetical protein